jgi:hydrogenase small subunit
MAFAAIGKDSVREFGVLWITAGLGCDGDTIAMTAAPTQHRRCPHLGKFPGFQKLIFIIPSSPWRSETIL